MVSDTVGAGTDPVRSVPALTVSGTSMYIQKWWAVGGILSGSVPGGTDPLGSVPRLADLSHRQSINSEHEIL